MITFQFPPAAGSSGQLRSLGFARYLPEFGWSPIVLTGSSFAHPRTNVCNHKLIPPQCEVHRALALDAGRHFAIYGKYPACLAKPDRWISWWPAALWQALRLIRRHHIDAIWSTYPIMTAHCIAHSVAHLTKLPWVADFRDPVAGSISASNRYAIASQRRWERRVLDRASRITFTTRGALDDYAARYPDAQTNGRLAVIENGYDEAVFAELPQSPPSVLASRPLMLVHSGLLYQDGRNPLAFFDALARLKASGDLADGDVRIVLRASGSETVYAREIGRLQIGGIVMLAPPVSNHEALIEQAQADGLLLFQGSRFDRQIPAKLYEYLRIRRPIFALVGEDGDTARLLRGTGGASIAPLEDAEVIRIRLAAWITALRHGHAPLVAPEAVSGFSRWAGARGLAGLLDGAAG